MNKKLLAIMIAATLLQGCTSFRQAENTRKDAVAEQQRAREMIAELRNRTPVVKESPRQWINPRPVTDKNPGNAVPGCPIIINTRQSITLQQVAQRISENCHIPVRITPDVQAYLSVTTSGSTQQIQGTVPPPDTGGMVPLAAIGSSDTTLPRLQGNTASLPELKASGLTSLLNAVASRLGISWRYDGSHITFYYLDTRTFPVTYMDSQVAYNATVVSGTMSSNGSSGGTASDAISGDASNTQTTTVDMKSALYQDVKNAVSSMLTPGIGRMFMSTGFITVTDTPQVLETVRTFIEKRNEEMKRQVVLNVEILSIRKTRNEHRLERSLQRQNAGTEPRQHIHQCSQRYRHWWCFHCERETHRFKSLPESTLFPGRCQCGNPEFRRDQKPDPGTDADCQSAELH